MVLEIIENDTIKNQIHILKSWPIFYSKIIADKKRHDLRMNDRNFNVGDVLILNEFDPDTAKYTGRCTMVEVTYITSVESPCAFSEKGLNSGYSILSIKLMSTITP